MPTQRSKRRRVLGVLASGGLADNAGVVALTLRDKAILDFERMWWADPEAKAEAIRDRFDLSADRYDAILVEVLGDPEAFQHDPLVVRRLARQRARRRPEPPTARPANDWPSR